MTTECSNMHVTSNNKHGGDRKRKHQKKSHENKSEVTEGRSPLRPSGFEGQKGGKLCWTTAETMRSFGMLKLARSAYHAKIWVNERSKAE
jgi:hypothetical protein